MKKLLSLLALLGLLAFVATPLYAQEEDAAALDEGIIAEAEDIDAEIADVDAETEYARVEDSIADEGIYELEDTAEGTIDLGNIESFNDIFENEEVQNALDEAGLTNEEAA